MHKSCTWSYCSLFGALQPYHSVKFKFDDRGGYMWGPGLMVIIIQSEMLNQKLWTVVLF